MSRSLWKIRSPMMYPFRSYCAPRRGGEDSDDVVHSVSEIQRQKSNELQLPVRGVKNGVRRCDAVWVGMIS